MWTVDEVKFPASLPTCLCSYCISHWVCLHRSESGVRLTLRETQEERQLPGQQGLQSQKVAALLAGYAVAEGMSDAWKEEGNVKRGNLIKT